MKRYLKILLSAFFIKMAGAFVIFSYFAYIDAQTFNANQAFWDKSGHGADWMTFGWILLLLGLIEVVMVSYYSWRLSKVEPSQIDESTTPDIPNPERRWAAAFPIIIALISLTTWLVAGFFYARGGLALLAEWGIAGENMAVELSLRALLGLVVVAIIGPYTLIALTVDKVWRSAKKLAILVGLNIVAWPITLALWDRGSAVMQENEIVWRTFLGLGVIGGLLTSTVVFLVVDYHWRAHLARFFPQGGLDSVDVPRVQVGHRLMVTSILSGLVPLLALGGAALSKGQDLQLIILFILAIGVLSNILLSLLTAKSLLRPLHYLTQAMQQFQQPDLHLGVPQVSNDELGDLTHQVHSQIHQNAQLLDRVQRYSEEVEEKNAALSELDKLKDEFLANTSHELRTPLNGIIGLAESLVDGATGPLSEETQANLKMIASSGKRLTTLVNDILDFSKLRHADIVLQTQPVDLYQLVELVLALSKPLVSSKPITLVNQLDKNLPAVNGDENRLQQILHNLIGNAIKFTSEGSVVISAAVEDDMLAVRVVDTGIGIPDDKRDLIFESFEQADASTTRLYGGTGLGLSITKQLVELHGGIITVDSVVGQGSCFQFTVPISADSVIIAPTQPQDIEMVATILPELEDGLPIAFNGMVNGLSTNGKMTKILVVDDEPVNRQVLKNHLSLENYEVIQATNGLEALKMIEDGPRPDLVLLDIMMPQMSGYEAIQSMRERYPANELPVVMLTAKNQVADLVQGFQTGANDYLTKPFSKNELLARIKTHLDLSNINRASDRFVPREFLKNLNKTSIVDVNLGDQTEREMTILFSDIRSFTSLSEQMTPQENFSFINEYLNRVSPIIRRHYGFIDKYIGDAIMALFSGTSHDAIQAAVEMQEAVHVFNEERQHLGHEPIQIGVGLHTGSVMLGTVGEAQRMDGTVISDSVNLASRMEGLTKMYGAGIMVTEQTLAGLSQKNAFQLRYLDKVKVKGKADSVAVFEVLNGNAPAVIAQKLQTLPHFETGIDHYQQGDFALAQACFAQVLTLSPTDKTAQLYLDRIASFEQYGLPTNWEGVAAIEEK